MKKIIVSLVSLILMLGLVGVVSAGNFGLDRNSGNIVLSPGTLDLTGGNYASSWDAKQGFQISLLKEESGNDIWNFNHYDPGTAYDWANYNFADYPYYYLDLDSTGNIAASFYTGGPTGELLAWALYYDDGTVNVQTVLGGTIENIAIDGSGTLTAFLRISPTNTYRTFDGTGEVFDPVNTVEIWNGLGMLTDLVGFNINQAGSAGGGTWTSTGDITLTADFIEVPTEVWVDDGYTDDGTNDGYVWGYTAFDTIQEGIDAVVGSTVNVAPGTYDENVIIAKSLDLIGAGSTTTTIDGNNVGNTVTITASNVKLAGFRVTGGWQDGGNDVFYPDGGVVVDGNGAASALTGITIEDNIIDGNSGNGVYISAAGHGGAASNVVIKDCEIFNNGGSKNYAGISLTHPNYILRPVGVWDEWRRPKNILVQGNTIHSNSNYGLYVSAGENNVIRSNEIWGNSKYGIQLASSWNRTDIPCEYTTVENNDIHDNARNGVKLTSYNQHNTFTKNKIYDNGWGYTGSKDYYKYGFLFQDGNDNTLEKNRITGNALGGLYLWGKGDPSYTWYSTTNNPEFRKVCDKSSNKK